MYGAQESANSSGLQKPLFLRPLVMQSFSPRNSSTSFFGPPLLPRIRGFELVPSLLVVKKPFLRIKQMAIHGGETADPLLIRIANGVCRSSQDGRRWMVE